MPYRGPAGVTRLSTILAEELAEGLRLVGVPLVAGPSSILVDPACRSADASVDGA